MPQPDAPQKKKRNVLSNILIVVGVALLIVAGVIYFRNWQNYKKIDDENEKVAEYAKLSDDSNTPPEVDWAALKAINPDVVGWLQIPGTVVNFPVFQTGDNDYYLDHAPDQSYSIGGSVFLDFECAPPGMVDPQTIVYGHHMRNGSQFKQIADMENQQVFDGVKTVWYVTEQNGPYDLMPLFLFYTSADDTYVRQLTFENDEGFRKYIQTYFEHAVAQCPNADQIVGQVKHLFTLSTCNYYDEYGRTLLVCAPKKEVPGTPEYEADTPNREAAEKAAAEKAAAEQAAAEQAAAEQAAAEKAAAEQAAAEAAAQSQEGSEEETVIIEEV